MENKHEQEPVKLAVRQLLGIEMKNPLIEVIGMYNSRTGGECGQQLYVHVNRDGMVTPVTLPLPETATFVPIGSDAIRELFLDEVYGFHDSFHGGLAYEMAEAESFEPLEEAVNTVIVGATSSDEYKRRESAQVLYNIQRVMPVGKIADRVIPGVEKTLSLGFGFVAGVATQMGTDMPYLTAAASTVATGLGFTLFNYVNERNFNANYSILAERLKQAKRIITDKDLAMMHDVVDNHTYTTK